MKKLIPALMVCAVVLAAGAVLRSAFVQVTSQKAPQGSVISLDGTWSEESSADPDKMLAVYHGHVPEGESFADGYFYMQSYWTEFEVQNEGEVVFTYFGDSSSGFVHLLSLGQLDAGEGLTVTFSVNRGDNLSLLYKSQFYIGDQNGIYNRILFDNMYAFVFFLMTLFLGVITLAAAFLLKSTASGSDRHTGIAAVGVFVITAGIWVLTDSKLLLLVTDRTATVALVSMLSFFFMPLFLLRFTRQIINVNKRVYYTVVLIYLVILDAYALNYIFKITSAQIFLTAEHAMSVVTMVMIFYYGLRDMRSTKNIKIRRALVGCMFFCVGSVAALAMFYTRPFSGYSQIYALGTTGFIVFLFDAACREVYEQLENNVSLEFQAKLAYVDAMTGIGNRAAFHEQQQKDRNIEGSIAYMLADVNNLKITNDTLGHAMGDKLIINAARCLCDAVGSLGECYRIGGDEFVARIAGTDEAELKACRERFYSLVEQSNAAGGIVLSAAIGCAWTDANEKDLDLLLGSADAEMYKEKQRMKGTAAKLG